MKAFVLFIKVKWFFLREVWEIRSQFPDFTPYQKAFKKAYRFHNPYRVSNAFLRQSNGKRIDPYGETPLPVFAQIAQECQLTDKDVILELGCGRGKGVFFLSHLLGCQVIGIDWIPFFTNTARKIASATPRLPISFSCEEMQSVDLSSLTAIYLYGTCLSDEEILSLIERFKSSPSSVQIITVSYPLSDYSSAFYTEKQFTSRFPWGETDIYLNLMNKNLF